MAEQEDPRRKDAKHEVFEVHQQMVVALAVATLVVGLIVAIAVLCNKLTALVVVAFAGSMGGFVSALRRLYSLERVFPANFFRQRLRGLSLYLVVYSLIPPLVGSIGAVMVYVIFATGLIQSPVFPQFGHVDAKDVTDLFDDFVRNWRPMGEVNYAKAIVWGFVAGFSERFLPDMLSKMGHDPKD